MSEKEAEVSAPDLELLEKQAKSQLLFTGLVMTMAVLMIMAAFVSNAFLFQKVKPLAKQTPEYRLKLVYVDIKQSHDVLAEHFKAYHTLFEKEDVQKLFTIAKNNENFPVESEEDLVALIEDYRSALFNLASNIPNSGEWHRYQRDQMRNFIESAKLRADTLKIMIASKKPQ